MFSVAILGVFILIYIEPIKTDLKNFVLQKSDQNVSLKRDFIEKKNNVFFMNTPNCTIRIERTKQYIKSGYPEPKILFSKALFNRSSKRNGSTLTGISVMPMALAENVLTFQNKTALNFTQKNNSIDRNEKEIYKGENKTEGFSENSKSIDNTFNEIVNEEALDALNHFVNNFVGEEIRINQEIRNPNSKNLNSENEKNNIVDKSIFKKNETQKEIKTENRMEITVNNNPKKSFNDSTGSFEEQKNIEDELENSFNKQVINEVIHKLFLAKNDEDKLEKLIQKNNDQLEKLQKNESTTNQTKASLDTLKKSDLAKNNESTIESVAIETINKGNDLSLNAKPYSKKRYTLKDITPHQTIQKIIRNDAHAQEKLINFVQKYQSYMNNFYKHVHKITHNPEFWKNVTREYNAQSSLKRYLVFGKYKPGPLVRAFLKISPNYKNVLQNAIEESSDPRVQNLLKLSSSYKAVLRAAIKRWSCYVPASKTVTGSKKDKLLVNEDTDIADEFKTKETNDPTKTFLVHLLDDTANPNIEAKPIYHYSQKINFPNGWTDYQKLSVLNQSIFYPTNDMEKLEQSKMEGPIYIESGNRKRLIPSSGMEYTDQNNLDLATADFSNTVNSLVNEDDESDDITRNIKSKTKIEESNQEKKEINRRGESNKKTISQLLKPSPVHIYENKEEFTGNDQYSLMNADQDTHNVINADQNVQEIDQNNLNKYEDPITKGSRDEQVGSEKIIGKHIFRNKYIGNAMNASDDVYVGEDNERVLTDIEIGNKMKERKDVEKLKPEMNEANLISDGINLLMSHADADDKANPSGKNANGNVIKLDPLKSYDFSNQNNNDQNNDHNNDQNNDEISYYENQLKQIKKEKEKEYLDEISKRVAMPKIVNSGSQHDLHLNTSGFNILKLMGRSQRLSLPDGFRTSWIRNSSEKGENRSLPLISKYNTNEVVNAELSKNITNNLEATNSYDKVYSKMENLEKDLPIEIQANSELVSDEMQEDIKSLSNSLQYYGENETLLSELTKLPDSTQFDSITKEENNYIKNRISKKDRKGEGDLDLSKEFHKQSHKSFNKKHSSGKIFDSNDRDSVNGIKKTIGKKKVKSS